MTTNASQVALRTIASSEPPFAVRSMQVHQRILTKAIEAGTFGSQVSFSVLENTELPIPSPPLLSSASLLVLAEDPMKTQVAGGVLQSALLSTERPPVDTRGIQSAQTTLVEEAAALPNELVIVRTVWNHALEAEQSPMKHPPTSQAAQLALVSTEALKLDVAVMRVAQRTLIADVQPPFFGLTSISNVVLTNDEAPGPNPELVSATTAFAAARFNATDPATILPEYGLSNVANMAASLVDGLTLPQSITSTSSVVSLTSTGVSFDTDVVHSDSIIASIITAGAIKQQMNNPATMLSTVQVQQIGRADAIKAALANPISIQSQAMTQQVSIESGVKITHRDPSSILSTNNVSNVAKLVSRTKIYPARVISETRVGVVSKLSGQLVTMRHPLTLISPINTSTVVGSVAASLEMRDPATITPETRLFGVVNQQASRHDYGLPVSTISVPTVQMHHATQDNKADPEAIKPTDHAYACAELVAISLVLQDPIAVAPESRRNIQTSYN